MNDLTCTVRTSSAGPVLALAGELDHHTVPLAQEALADATPEPGQQLTIDLTGLAFCDSSGIGLLIAARNTALAARAGIALASVPEHVARVFRITGLDRVFATHLTARDATEAWRRARTV
ncbi:STAS domain-containing protein [Streptomyces sp. NBC_00344]|uniref:STAS domain-containing protein n=1 Tax=Streptomyces sp. NBC_00344 TaxID=2975720 RepID=UPI002E1F1421